MAHTPAGTRRYIAFLAVACVAVLLAGCGSRVVRDQQPFVQINGLALEADALVLDLGVRNVNEVPMDLVHVDFRLALQDTELAVIDEPRQGSIIATGSETLQFRFSGANAGLALLRDLQNGKLISLPYTLEGSILTTDDHSFPFKGGGHLYPVPGRPGQFR